MIKGVFGVHSFTEPAGMLIALLEELPTNFETIQSERVWMYRRGICKF